MKKLYLPEKIRCSRIILKKHDIDLAEQMFEYVEKDRERLREFLPWVDHTNEVEDERNFIRFSHKEWDEFSLFDYGIFTLDDSVYIGNIGIHSIKWDAGRAEIGYWILSDFEGNGYITEALLNIEKLLFGIGFNRIEIRCDSCNRKSSSVPERNGYKLDGILRENAIYKNSYIDTMVFSKLKRDFFKGRKTEIIEISDKYYARKLFDEEKNFIYIQKKNNALFTKIDYDDIPENNNIFIILKKGTDEPVGTLKRNIEDPSRTGINIMTSYKKIWSDIIP